MSNVEQVESQVRGLSADELRAFRNWFAQFDAEAWDRQIETDSKNGALNALADRAVADHEARRSVGSRTGAVFRRSGLACYSPFPFGSASISGP
jgi:hypothetical protein